MAALFFWILKRTHLSCHPRFERGVTKAGPRSRCARLLKRGRLWPLLSSQFGSTSGELGFVWLVLKSSSLTLQQELVTTSVGGHPRGCFCPGLLLTPGQALPRRPASAGVGSVVL